MGDKRVFYATVQSHRYGSVEPHMVMVGAKFATAIRNDGNEGKDEPSAGDLYATLREIQKAKTCVFHWYPFNDTKDKQKFFRDAQKDKDVFHAFMMFLYIEGQKQNRAHLKKAKVTSAKNEPRFGGEVVSLTCESVEIIDP
jgi:hypothetical protein